MDKFRCLHVQLQLECAQGNPLPQDCSSDGICLSLGPPGNAPKPYAPASQVSTSGIVS